MNEQNYEIVQFVIYLWIYFYHDAIFFIMSIHKLEVKVAQHAPVTSLF